ncbi:MAG TPA: hypothetical protein VJT09_18610 [Pyrinomonadaceae bacterium]|nr:hypothetical protein [Pyrinomonadaceae bacterium]
MFAESNRRWMSRIAAAVLSCTGLWALTTPSASAQAVPGYCAPPYKINWPAANPVWSLCWLPPDNSSGVDGSGLELRHVFYKGKRVFWQAHVPVLNVKYDPGGCGGSDLSYRDWQNSPTPFDANNVLSIGYAEPTVPPTTVCDHPGTDSGMFSGVAVEKGGGQLILTTQMQAGWYRYIQKWTFYPDGTIEPRFGFTAITAPCTSKPHNHHVYFRFDFDIDGAANDAIEERNLFWSLRATEASRNYVPLVGRRWRVRDKSTGRGYQVIPGAHDGVADAWAVADVWALLYRFSEIDDGGATGGPNGDAAHMNNYVNGENINGRDVVLWTHAMNRHATGIGCEFTGPTLKPFGPW